MPGPCVIYCSSPSSGRSFNLIGEYLAGQVDSYFAVLTRVLLAGLVFSPLLARRRTAFRRRVMLVGALQFGITYVCLYLSSTC